jgi:hypothetical protein
MIEWLTSIIKALVLGKFYGKVILTFENGKLVSVKKEESLKVP